MIEAQATVALGELADRANREHALVEQALGGALQHALACGDALNEAREAVEYSGWMAWLEQNFTGSRVLASQYMRLAAHRVLVEGLPSITQGLERLRGLPAVRRGGYRGHSDETKAEARVLDAEGVHRDEIATTFGVSRQTINQWCDPEVLARARASTRRWLAEQREEERQQKAAAAQRKAERAARKAGGALAESYSLVHRLDAPLAQARREATGEARDALDAAVSAYYKLSDEVVRALGVS